MMKDSNLDDHDDFASQAEEDAPGLIAEFWDFLIHNKKWWLIPIVLVLAAVGVFVVLTGTAAAPFLYTFW
jgi:hypothetical protein